MSPDLLTPVFFTYGTTAEAKAGGYLLVTQFELMDLSLSLSLSHRLGRPGVELTGMHDHINRVLQVLPFASEVGQLSECLSSHGTGQILHERLSDLHRDGLYDFNVRSN